MSTLSQYHDPFITFAIVLTPLSTRTKLVAQYVLSIVKRMHNIGTSYINFRFFFLFSIPTVFFSFRNLTKTLAKLYYKQWHLHSCRRSISLDTMDAITTPLHCIHRTDTDPHLHTMCTRFLQLSKGADHTGFQHTSQL